MHASGELQRVLRKEPEERSAVRPPREKRHEEPEAGHESRWLGGFGATVTEFASG